MPKFQIFHTERNIAAGLPYSQTGMSQTRREGIQDGYQTRALAQSAMLEMQTQARANGQPEYADALHVELFDYA